MNQWNRVEIPETNSCTYSQTIFTSMPWPHNGKRTIPSTYFFKKLYIHVQNNEIGPIPYIIYKNELKTDLTVRPKTINSEKKSFRTLNLSMISWLWHWSTGNKSKNRQTGLHHNLKLPSVKGYTRTKRQPRKWGQVFANHISAKGLIPRIQKELIQLNNKKANNLILKWAKELNSSPKKIWKWQAFVRNDAQHHSSFSSVQFSRSFVSDSSRPHGQQPARPPCPSPIPWVYSNSCPSSWWCLPNISSTVVPFASCLQSFPASRSFPNESVLRIRWPKYWSFSFKISPSNGYSGLISFRISLQFKGL